MNKALLLTTIALVAFATVAMPSASACYSTNPTANYVVCGSEKYDDVNDAIEYAKDGVRLVLQIIDNAT